MQQTEGGLLVPEVPDPRKVIEERYHWARRIADEHHSTEARAKIIIELMRQDATAAAVK